VPDDDNCENSEKAVSFSAYNAGDYHRLTGLAIAGCGGFLQSI
jgi:hypothetical protein